MSQPVHLGIDVGGTASRWVACGDDGIEIARGKAPGATGHVFNPAEKARLEAVLTTIAGAVTASGLTVKTLTAGLTGYGSAALGDVEAVLTKVFALDSGDIIITDDVVMAYIANFAPGEGHLISAGTGSIGLHIGDEGYVRVGGRGILIDDAGSGSWIALRALDQLYRTLDHAGGFGENEVLARHLFDEVGGGDWHHVRQFVYAGDRGRIGMLAVAVARAAEEGDKVAVAILQVAGGELARLAEALIARVGDRPTGFVGGVLGLHPLISAAIRDRLAGREILMLDADACLSAARLQAAGDERWRKVLAVRSSIS